MAKYRIRYTRNSKPRTIIAKGRQRKDLYVKSIGSTGGMTKLKSVRKVR